MTKIANHVFQIFLYSIFTLYELKISCTLKRERIFNDWHKIGMEKIEKRCLKITN